MPADMKGIIADTLLQMVQHTSVDNITVTALIDRCHISRQTFYYHFENLMDVLEWGVRQTTRQLVEQSLSAKDIHAALQIFISFSVERFPLLQKMLDSQHRAQVERIMIEAVSAYLNELARNRHLDLSVSYSDREVLLQYTAYGLVGVLLSYCEKPDLDRDRLAHQLERILSGQLSGWIPPAT